MRLTPLNLLLATFLLAAPLAIGCSGGETPGDDDSSQTGDDDATHQTGDDDATHGDDDTTTGDDDTTTGDDDTTTGDDDASSVPVDKDGDGAYTPADCDDDDSSVYPGAAEVCDEKDNDCDEQTDEDVQNTYYYDVDGDGYGDVEAPTLACEAPADYVEDDTDCDDDSDDVYPGAEEFCDNADNDCNGQIDEGVQNTYYADADSDGDGDTDSARTLLACTLPNGYAETGADCDDADATVYSGATELCDGKDNDCDTETDEGVLKTFYTDADHDAFGTDASAAPGCQPSPGQALVGGDCNDSNEHVNPSAAETCNGIDDNCDGAIDNNVGDFFYPDADGDDYGDKAATAVQSCDPVANHLVSSNTDCNDKDKTVYPGAPEDGGASDGYPDGKDNNCDGVLDEGTLDETLYDMNQGQFDTGEQVAAQGVVAITGLTQPFVGFGGQQMVGFFVNEQAGGDYAGILVQIAADKASEIPVKEGDLVTFTGTYQQFNGNSTVVLAASSDVAVTGTGVEPDPISEEQACNVGAETAYAAMRVEVTDITADSLNSLGFTYNGCLNVSSALFFPVAQKPKIILDQSYASVTGVLFSRSQFDLEVTSIDELEESLFSYVDNRGGTFSTPVTVTFQANDPAAVIYYTVDGSTPTTTSSLAQLGSSITIGLAPTTLQYFAKANGVVETTIHKETYRFVRAANPHLLVTEVVVTPTEAEFIEIYNPTPNAVLLDGYYLTDDAGGTASSYEYAKMVIGDKSKIVIDSSDFIVSFPTGSSIMPYEFLVVAMHDSFSTAYATVTPDFELSKDTDGVPNMVPVLQTNFTTTNPGLGNANEMVMLFYWDGLSDLVSDVDYVVWGPKGAAPEAVDKSNIALDGPDSGTQTTLYKPDTAKALQQVAATKSHLSEESFCRTDYTESSEQNLGGNGTSGQDETSEPLSTTWTICKHATPGYSP